MHATDCAINRRQARIAVTLTAVDAVSRSIGSMPQYCGERASRARRVTTSSGCQIASSSSGLDNLDRPVRRPVVACNGRESQPHNERDDSIYFLGAPGLIRFNVTVAIGV